MPEPKHNPEYWKNGVKQELIAFRKFKKYGPDNPCGNPFCTICVPVFEPTAPDPIADSTGFPFDDNTAGEQLTPVEMTEPVVSSFEDSFVPGVSARAALTNTHHDLCCKALNLMMQKNKDYACETDLFRNFRYFGPLGVLVRLSDKLARLRTFEERDVFSVTDESLRDTIQDAINYLVIYYCMKTEAKK